MSLTRNDANPCLLTSTRYLPTARLGTEKVPVASDVALRTAPVSAALTTISAPETTAPELSVMTPEIDAVCAMARVLASTTTAKSIRLDILALRAISQDRTR